MTITKNDMLCTAFSIADTVISQYSGTITDSWQYDAALTLRAIATLYDKDYLCSLLHSIVSDILRVRDKSGVWYQVLDSNEPGNYKEATCSCMFAYTINKAIINGYFKAEEYSDILSDVISSFFREFIRQTPNATFITSCCKGAGLGPDNHRERDGSLQYYFSEKTRNNDFKGVGPFLMLAANYFKE